MEKEKVVNVRSIFLGLGSIIVIIAMFLTDQDGGIIQDLPFGSSTATFLIYLSTAIIGVGLLYLCERALFYYVDYYDVYKKALLTENGPGMIMVAISLQMIAVAIVFNALLN